MLTALSVCWPYCYSLVYACLAISASANTQFKHYYEKALIAPDQIRACGIFTQWSGGHPLSTAQHQY